MARLIIGHTTDTSSKIWIRGDKRYPVGFVTLTSGESTKTKTLVLEERHGYTGVIEFKQLTSQTDYGVRVEFGESTRVRPLERVSFGDCTGQFKTFHSSEENIPVNFIFGSCNLHSLGLLSNPDFAYTRIHEEALNGNASFMIHCGDQIYYDIPNPAKIPTIDEYRDKYLDAWKDSRPTRKFLCRLPHYMILDDHEIINDFCNDQEDTVFGVSARQYLDIATKVYREFQHIRHPHPYGNQALYYSFTVGVVEFFVLDTRTQRYKGTKNHPAQMISEVQLQEFLHWLKEKKNSVKFVVTSVPFVFEVKHSEDKWNATSFRYQREAIMKWIIENEITGITFLTGDMHCSGRAKLEIKKGGKTVEVQELMSSPINQLGKTSIGRFEPLMERQDEAGEFTYKTTLINREFYDSHSNATLVSISNRTVTHSIFRTKSRKSGRKKFSYSV